MISYGAGNVLVITEDEEVYGMGYADKSTNRYDDYYAWYFKSENESVMYNIKYPTPKKVQLDGNIIDYKNGYSYVKTDEGYIYEVHTRGSAYEVSGSCRNVTNTYFSDKTKEEILNMTMEEIKERISYVTYSSSSIDVDNQNHRLVITNKQSGSTDLTYTYIPFPNSINVIKFSEDGNILIDSNNNLWVKGSYTGLGTYFENYVCLNKIRYTREAIWNNIRDRWQLIKKSN